MARPRTTVEDKREKARIRKQKQRARSEEERRSRPIIMDAMSELTKADFAEFLLENDGGLSIANESLRAGGIVINGDLRTEDHHGVYPEEEVWEDIYSVPLNSLNRTVVMIGGLLDAALELATSLNQFKVQEIDRCIVEAEENQASLGEIERLYRFKARLQRSVQVRLPVYFVGGE